MTALAVAFVIVAVVAAVAYAAPKFYWYRLQGTLMREQSAAEDVRFAAIKESHDLGKGPDSDTSNASSGQYI